jgi:flagellar motor switch protein FliM
MLEPIRDLLDAGVQSDRGEKDERWERAMREEILDAKVDIGAELAQVELTVEQLSELQVGDIIPIEIAEQLEVSAEGLPLFHGTLGVHKKHYAIKVGKWIDRPKSMDLSELIALDRRNEPKAKDSPLPALTQEAAS